MESLTLNYLQKAINEIDGVTVGDSKPSDRYFMKSQSLKMVVQTNMQILF